MILRFFLPLRNTLASLYICLEAGGGAGGEGGPSNSLYKPLWRLQKWGLQGKPI